MNLDPRIIEGKRVLTPFEIEEAEQFNGLSGYFSNVTDDFKHLENAAHGVLDLTFGPDAWVMKELNREIVLKRCHEIKGDLAVLWGKQNLLLKCICNHRCGYDEPGDKAMVWHMRDVLDKAYDQYRKLLKDFEEGNY